MSLDTNFETTKKVNVYISTSDPMSSRIQHLQNLFQSDLFEVFIVQLDIPSDDSLVIPASFNKDSTIEYNKVQWCFNDSASKDDTRVAMYLSDKLVTNASPQLMEHLISTLLDKRWDICYLNKWLDSCDEYSKDDVIHANGTVFTSSTSPHGVEAIMVRPFVRDVVRGIKSFDQASETPLAFQNSLGDTLQKAIASKQIVATTISPNLFNIDVATISASEAFKLNECRDTSTSTENSLSTKPIANSTLNQDTLNQETLAPLVNQLEGLIPPRVVLMPDNSSNTYYLLLLIFLAGLAAYFVFYYNKKPSA